MECFQSVEIIPKQGICLTIIIIIIMILKKMLKTNDRELYQAPQDFVWYEDEDIELTPFGKEFNK